LGAKSFLPLDLGDSPPPQSFPINRSPDQQIHIFRSPDLQITEPPNDSITELLKYQFQEGGAPPPGFTQFHPTSPKVTQAPGSLGNSFLACCSGKPANASPKTSPKSPDPKYRGQVAPTEPSLPSRSGKSAEARRLRVVTPEMQNPAQSRVVKMHVCHSRPRLRRLGKD
jgi:hypothetical protein